MNLESAILGFLGAVLGGLLVPVVSHYLDKGKHKVKLRLELVSFVHTIHQIFKAEVSHKNYVNLISRQFDIDCRMFNSTSDETIKALLMERINANEKILNDHRPRSTELFNQITQVEADLVKTVIDIRGTYGNEVYTKVNSIVEGIILNASSYDYFCVHNFYQLTQEQISEFALDINTPVNARIGIVNKDCLEKKEQLNRIFEELYSVTYWDRFTSTKLWALITFKWAARD